MNNTTQLNVPPTTTVYEWNLEFYSPTEEEWMDVSYYTFVEDSQMAREQLIIDEEGQVEDLKLNKIEHTYSNLKDQGLDLETLILDYEYTTQEDLENNWASTLTHEYE